MTLAIFSGLLGSVLIAGSFVPYIRDILKADTEPHVYTWFIWSITQAIAAFAIFEGSGGIFAATSVATGAVLSFVVFLMSFKHGTKNVSDFDTITLAIALMSIVIWWRLNQPDWAIVAIALIDILGFLPTFRKTWHQPNSESAFAWVLFLLGNIAALLSLTHYSIMTSFYIISMIIASGILVGIILRPKRLF